MGQRPQPVFPLKGVFFLLISGYFQPGRLILAYRGEMTFLDADVLTSFCDAICAEFEKF